MSSQESNPKATWGSQEIAQLQHPDPPSTNQASINQGDANPPPKGVKQPQNTLSFKRRFFSFVLVPLILATLIFLFILPFALRGQTFLPPLSLAVLLIALVVMQGVLLYYARSNNGY
jgi:hypothetical protein